MSSTPPTSRTSPTSRVGQCGAALTDTSLRRGATSTMTSASMPRVGLCGAALTNTSLPRGAISAENISAGSHKCLCKMRSNDFFSSSKKSQNDHSRVIPIGSTTNGRVGTDEGSARSTPDPRRNKTPSQPKPSNQQNADKEIKNLLENIPKILSGAFESTNDMIFESIRRAGDILESRQSADYWKSKNGQQELSRRLRSGIRGHRTGS